MRFVCRYVLVLLAAITIGICFLLIFHHAFYYSSVVGSLYPQPSIVQQIQHRTSLPTQQKCRFHSCFDVFRCQLGKDWKVKIYVYPRTKFITQNNNKDLFREYSHEFEEFVKSMGTSTFSTANASEACLFIPPIDLLSEKGIDLELASSALYSLDR